MSNALIEKQYLNDIADAIRGKNGSNQVYYPSEMAQAITDIPTGNNNILYRLPYTKYAERIVEQGLGPGTLNINLVKSSPYDGCVVLYTDPNFEPKYQCIESEGLTQISILEESIALVAQYSLDDKISDIFAVSSNDVYRLTGVEFLMFNTVSPVDLFSFLQNSHSNNCYLISLTMYQSRPHNITVYTDTRPCFIKGTKITLADGSTKNCEDITFDDELLVWNFYEGKFDISKPLLISKPHVAPNYNLLELSDGTKIGFVGTSEYHRIYNNEYLKFTGTNSDETPIGTTTFKDDGSTPKIISKKIISENVEYYNIITEKHYNCFVNGVLSSCRLSNEYAIKDMRYSGGKLISDKEKEEYIKSKIDNVYLWKHN